MKAKLDPLIEQAIRKAAAENNVNYSVAREVVMNNFNWLRSSISKAEYAGYIMPRFAKFEYFVRPKYKGIDVNEEDYLEYVNNRKIKERRMIIEDVDENEYDPNIIKIIDDICKIKPCDLTELQKNNDFKKAYWCHGDEHGWNRKYMLITYDLDKLVELKNILYNE